MWTRAGRDLLGRSSFQWKGGVQRMGHWGLDPSEVQWRISTAVRKDIKALLLESCNKNKSRLEFSTSSSAVWSFYESETVPAWRLSWESLLNLFVPMSVGMCPNVWCMSCVYEQGICLSVSGMIVHNKGLCSLFIEWHRKYHMEKGMEYFTEIFNRVLKALSCWLQLIPTDQIADIIVYQPVTINGCFQPLW